MELKVGLKNEVSEMVVYEKTAKAMGSGLQPVYATPSMVALMEKCCCDSVIPYLEEGYATVGTGINIKHLSATPMERKVRVESVLKEIDRRRLVFDVVAYDEAGKIGEGEHERFIIDTEKFLKKAQEK
ncbi:MAG: thioesterase [Lachnospiraceae bacterium]|nr:thioesterase [Lachnospiraceae bacterium]